MEEKTVVFQVLSDHAAAVDVIAGKAAGQQLILSAGTFVIGRDSDADLNLADDAGVSRVHAKIVADGVRYRLVDNESRNGTLLNGQPIATVLLTDGDTVTIGECVLMFRQPSTRGAAGAGRLGVMPGHTRTPTHLPVSNVQPALPVPMPLSAAPTSRLSPALVAGVAAVTTFAVVGLIVVIVTLVPTTTTTTTTTTTPTTTPVIPVPPPPPVVPPPPAEPTFAPATAESKAEAVRVGERGGRVQSLPFKVGDAIAKNAVIAVIVGDVGNAADIATRRESISALSEIADGNERAAQQLETEKTELAALLAKAPTFKVTSPVAGTLTELFVKMRETVRSAQMIARVSSDETTVRARVGAEVAAALGIGAACDLQLGGGTSAPGSLREKADRGNGEIELVISAGAVVGVTGARCR